MQNGTLRQKVYDYLSRELMNLDLSPDAYIDQNSICEHLNISRAPLRDALIQLEAEGFVKIFPRKGVRINRLTLQDIENYYEILAAVESHIVASQFHKFRSRHVKRMEALNRQLYDLLDSDRFEEAYSQEYFYTNLKFHDVFNALTGNRLINRIIDPLKQRLYDFPRMHYNREWERINLGEHDRFIYSIKAGNRDAAVAVIRNEHWGFKRHKKWIIKTYKFSDDN